MTVAKDNLKLNINERKAIEIENIDIEKKISAKNQNKKGYLYIVI